MNLLGTTACPDLAYLCTKVASSSYIYIEILDKLGQPWFGITHSGEGSNIHVRKLHKGKGNATKHRFWNVCSFLGRICSNTHTVGKSQCALHISWDKLRSTPGSWKSCFALLFLQVSNIGSRSSSSTPWAGERLSLFTVSGEVLAVLAKIWYFMPRPQPANSSFTANNIFCKYFAAL